MMKEIKVAKADSKGVTVAKAYIYREETFAIPKELINDSNKHSEYQKFESAKAEIVAELKVLAEKEEIFAAHLMLAEDFTLADGVKSKIYDDNMNVQMALQKTVDEIVAVFDMMPDEYMKERAADIKDIGKRYLTYLQGRNMPRFQDIDESVILVAKDLLPSDTAKLDLKYMKGFITEEGGVTSHVCIMAKGIGLPALVGVHGIMEEVKDGDILCMDAKEGTIIINPDKGTLDDYQERIRLFEEQEELLKKAADLPSKTLDGKCVQVCGNAGNIAEVKHAVERHAEGIGLFRSEFLYFENAHFPSEEEQFEAYRDAAKACPKELTIRTLDIGGDKVLPYYEFDKETNPFLGWRGIRISLEMEEMFHVQLRAILRASIYGHIRIMFPMIISLEELRASKCVLSICKEELKAEDILFDPNIEVGMMIETPASVMLVDKFAAEVDFFSIGTNDLTQYLLAVDRGNKKISYMYNSFHPAVLKAIYIIVQGAHEAGIKVGVCGEFASNIHAIKILLGMGLDEFSVSPSNIAQAKYTIRNIAFAEAKELVAKVLRCDTVEKVLMELNA